MPAVSSPTKLIGLTLGPLVQSTEEVEIDGEIFPPDFHWYANISAAREDGKDFYVKLRIPPDQVHPQQIWTYISHALLSLETHMKEEK